MILKIVNLVVFSAAFLGLYFLAAGTALYALSVVCILLTIWIDFLADVIANKSEKSVGRIAAGLIPLWV